MQEQKAVEPITEKNPEEQKEPRLRRKAIVGGTAADPNRYPSVVFLSDREGALSCGGTLISPTMVLTAAHCEVSLVVDVVFGRDFTNNVEQTVSTENFPSFPQPNGEPQPQNFDRIKVQQELKHPSYDQTFLKYDIMLLQLERAPHTEDLTFMKLDSGSALEAIINTTTTVPASRVESATSFTGDTVNDNTLMALGWGHTTISRVDIGQPSDALQQAGLGLVTNEECEAAQEGLWLSYRGRISEDMMCTFAPSRDSCYGDSGGPVILPGDSPEEDVQVGIISWGEQCADQVFPGVAARVSFGYDWIRKWVCALDKDTAPEYFACEPDSTFSPAPTPSPIPPTVSPAPSVDLVPIVVNLLFDAFAEEISWIIVDEETGEIVTQRTFGYYKHENEVRETLFVRPGHLHTFTIKDMYGDGITNGGYYQIFADQPSSEYSVTEQVMIIHATTFTGREQQQTFYAPPSLPKQIDIVTSTQPNSFPSIKPSSKPAAEPIREAANPGRLCVADGYFCRNDAACCSFMCRAGLCLEDPFFGHDQRNHDAGDQKTGSNDNPGE